MSSSGFKKRTGYGRFFSYGIEVDKCHKKSTIDLGTTSKVDKMTTKMTILQKNIHGEAEKGYEWFSGTKPWNPKM